MTTKAPYTIKEALEAFETLEDHFSAIRLAFESSGTSDECIGWDETDGYLEFHERMIGSAEMFEKLIGIAHALGDPV